LGVFVYFLALFISFCASTGLFTLYWGREGATVGGGALLLGDGAGTDAAEIGLGGRTLRFHQWTLAQVWLAASVFAPN
jgi:hypothetical protein